MIERYKTISIIYGGSGGRYAKNLNDKINNYEKTDRYPLSSRIVMDQILTKNILDEVTALFRETEFCIAILTAEDCCVKENGTKTYRLRQNVIFELGMALFHLGRENCILLGNFADIKDQVELPSDMIGLDIRFFDDKTEDYVMDVVLEKLLKLSQSKARSNMDKKNVPQYNDLLRRKTYYVDYAQLFNRYDTKILINDKDYLKVLLNNWLDECKSLKYFDERIVYVLERIAFMPIFGKQDKASNWYLSVEDVVGDYMPRDIEYYGGSALLKFAKTVFKVVNNYIKFKMVYGAEPTQSDYEELLLTLKLNPPPKNETVNPLIEVLYYDYMGLINMHMYASTKNMEYVEKAQWCYEKVINEYLDRVDLGLSIWGGFLYYNLARLYGLKWSVDHNSIDQELLINTYLQAISIRKGWVMESGFNEKIQNAISFEYFIAKIDYIHQIKALKLKTDAEIEEEYKKVEKEINKYFNADERVERLVFVQEKLKNARLD